MGIFPKLNGYTLNKDIERGWVVEEVASGTKYRVQRVDHVPRLTSLYLEWL